jgi:hypothetical protein
VEAVHPEVDCVWLAENLAGVLSAASPDGFIVAADPPGHVGISLEPGRFPGDETWVVAGVCSIVEQEGDVLRHVEAACYSVLSTVQDFIVETLHDIWPMWNGSSENRPTLPCPMVKVHEARVDLSYCTDGEEAMGLGSIPFHR